MSWLAPLYLAGALAIAAPVLFHLWRRTPRGRRQFSTLMFLVPSPPRVTSLSRMEHWLLLLLRASALALLALAFARPVWRIPATLPIAPDETELVAILVDTSASMQREGLWPQVLDHVEKKVADLPASAIVALFHFDRAWQTDVSFEESQPLTKSQRQSLIIERVKSLKPTWNGTRLGDALMRTAQAVQEAQAGRSLPCPQQIWMVSDMQAGSDRAALREFDWPADLPVEWIACTPASGENAGLQLVASATGAEQDKLRVRVSNAASSTRQKFEVHWGDEQQTKALDVVVPPGQSRVLSLPAPPTEAAGTSVLLTGDEQPFDNRLWLPVRQARQCTVAIFGPEKADDTAGMRFYLQGALASNPRYDVTVLSGDEPLLTKTPPALVVATAASAEASHLLPKLRAAGADILLVPSSADDARQLLADCGVAGAEIAESDKSDYAMWSQIDFESPWFAPFIEAQFGDFSGIRFWRHRRWTGGVPPGSEVLVRFDDGDPAIVQLASSTGQGHLWWMASGWHPTDSQLSRSTKFVPLMWRILESALGTTPQSSAQTVGEAFARPSEAGDELTLTVPDGQQVPWPVDRPTFDQTSVPGRYTLVSPAIREVIAVNLPADESRTDPLPPEQLEAAGVTLSVDAQRPALPPSVDELRQQQLRELEERQQLWRWMLVIVGGLLVLETIIAMVLQRRSFAAATE